jgi:hypothetical protein
MELYWKNLRIEPGITVEVDENDDALSRKRVVWKIIDIAANTKQHAFYELGSGRTYPLESVMKKRKLQKKQASGTLIQIPPSSDFLVVQRYHDGEEIGYFCYSVDLLSRIRDIRAVD